MGLWKSLLGLVLTDTGMGVMGPSPKMFLADPP